MAMLPDDERRVRRNWTLLKQELHVEDFIQHFVDLAIFPPTLRNDIMNVIPNTASMKCEKFLNALIVSGHRAYQVLCALLRQTTDNRYSQVIEALVIPANVNMDVLRGHTSESRPSTAQSSASSGTINSETGERNRRIKPVAGSNDPPPSTQQMASASGTPVAAVYPTVAVPPGRNAQPTAEQDSGEPRASTGDANATPAVFQIPENVKAGEIPPTVTVNSLPTVTVGATPQVHQNNQQGQVEQITGNGSSDVSVDMKTLEQELVRIAPTIADLFHKIAKQTQSNPTSEEDIQKVKEENERLRKTNKSLIEKLNTFQQKIIQLQLDNKRLRESSDIGMVKKKELQQKTNELKEMEHRLNEHKKALEEKEMELNIQLEKLKDIEEENEFHRQKIDKLEELQDEGILERNIQQEQISSLVEEKEKQKDQIDSLEEQQKMGEQRLYRLEERLKMLEQGPVRPGRGRRVVSPPRNSSHGNSFWMNGNMDRSHHANIKYKPDTRNYNQPNYNQPNFNQPNFNQPNYMQSRDMGKRQPSKVAAVRLAWGITRSHLYYIILVLWLLVVLLYAVLHLTPTVVVHKHGQKYVDATLTSTPLKQGTAAGVIIPGKTRIFEQHFSNHSELQSITNDCTNAACANIGDSVGLVDGKHEFVGERVKSHHSKLPFDDYCDGRFLVYNGSFAKVSNVTLFKTSETHAGDADTKQHDKDRHGTESRATYAKLELECPEDDRLLNVTLMKHGNISPVLSIHSPESIVSRRDVNDTRRVATFTIALAIDKFGDLYDQLQQVFTTFWMHKFLGQSPDKTIVVDLNTMQGTIRNKVPIYSILQVLFGPVIEAAKLEGSKEQTVQFQNLALLLRGGFNPFSHPNHETYQLWPEFKRVVLNRYGLDGKHSLDCNRLQILLLWRRDRPDKYIERKIFNEAELYQTLVDTYPKACVRGILMDVLPMKEQLAVIQHTDLLIGMHGEELAHALFLPNTSGIVEMFPRRQNPISRETLGKFQQLAQMRQLHYAAWENKQALLEMPHYFTVIDVESVISRINTLVAVMCGQT